MEDKSTLHLKAAAYHLTAQTNSKFQINGKNLEDILAELSEEESLRFILEHRNEIIREAKKEGTERRHNNEGAFQSIEAYEAEKKIERERQAEATKRRAPQSTEQTIKFLTMKPQPPAQAKPRLNGEKRNTQPENETEVELRWVTDKTPAPKPPESTDRHPPENSEPPKPAAPQPQTPQPPKPTAQPKKEEPSPEKLREQIAAIDGYITAEKNYLTELHKHSKNIMKAGDDLKDLNALVRRAEAANKAAGDALKATPGPGAARDAAIKSSHEASNRYDTLKTIAERISYTPEGAKGAQEFLAYAKNCNSLEDIKKKLSHKLETETDPEKRMALGEAIKLSRAITSNYPEHNARVMDTIHREMDLLTKTAGKVVENNAAYQQSQAALKKAEQEKNKAAKDLTTSGLSEFNANPATQKKTEDALAKAEEEKRGKPKDKKAQQASEDGKKAIAAATDKAGSSDDKRSHGIASNTPPGKDAPMPDGAPPGARTSGRSTNLRIER